MHQLTEHPEILGIEKICPHCSARFSFCEHCWRGQKYCCSECSKAARIIKRRITEQRYASSPKGRLNRRLRQKKFRIKKILGLEVTDQSRKQTSFELQTCKSTANRQTLRPRYCCRCEQKLKIIKRMAELSDTSNTFFSFMRFKEARGRLVYTKTLEPIM